jgi:predicted acetyltransferase
MEGFMGEAELIPARVGDAGVLANLLELYAHDFSEFRELEIGEDGRFGYTSLGLYWSEAGRHPFLIRIEGKLAGLVLVARNESAWDMAEFFVMRGARRRGVGSRVAHEVWRRFPGPWEVRVIETNVAGRAFWAGVISTFTSRVCEPVRVLKGGVGWYVFSFAA